MSDLVRTLRQTCHQVDGWTTFPFSLRKMRPSVPTPNRAMCWRRSATSAGGIGTRRTGRRACSISARRAAEVVVFPRFHQWDAVLKLEADSAANGSGEAYLVQHSAGSGKSNTIAWTAHRLSTLPDAEDHKVFDKVVVITDRVILDRQLQETIYQFEHARGLVVKIDEDSGQLAEALTGEQAKIIITTLQKFPFVLDKVGTLPARNYAVIIDEAHSSQSGEAAKDDLRLALGAGEEQELTAAVGARTPSAPPDNTHAPPRMFCASTSRHVYQLVGMPIGDLYVCAWTSTLCYRL